MAGDGLIGQVPAIDPVWLRLGAGLGIGLLIGLERERNPAARAGVRTFALIGLFGALAAEAGTLLGSVWMVPVGLAAVAAMLIAAHAAAPERADPGTTTVAAGAVCFLLGVLAGFGEARIAGALAIAVTALLYFKPEIEGLSTALGREEQVSVLQFLVVTFIVLPLAPDAGYGPYGVLNPRGIWLVVVLISGIGLASYIALRTIGEKHGTLVIGLLGGMVSSTATTVLYARHSRESPGLRTLAGRVVPLANLVPLVRIGVLAAVLAPALLPKLAPSLVAALVAGGLVHAALWRRGEPADALPPPAMRNPAAVGTAMRFAALYAVVLVLTAWLSDLAGPRGLAAAALASGVVDIDPILLSAFALFESGRESAATATTMIGLAFVSNVAFKLGVAAWHDRSLAVRVFWPLAAALVAGAAMIGVAA